MLRRLTLFCLSVWLIAAGGLSAQAAPCQMTPEAETAAISSHCDMAGAPVDQAPDPARAVADACCCPAVLAALAAPEVPAAMAARFTLPVVISAPLAPGSRNPIPEPPPPKA